MATALELGPEGWKPYLEGLKSRPEPALSPEQIVERDRLIEKAREAAAMLKEKYGARRVILFGSLAHKAWFHARSDVDLAVEGIPPDDFYEAWEDAILTIRGRGVDLLRLETAPAGMLRAIREDGVLL